MSREMKYSGIPWIGEIPNGWSTIQAKFYCKSVYAGGTPDSNNMDYWDGDIPWLPSGACQDCVVKEAKKFITQAGFDNSSTKLIPPYTTIMAMTGATCGNVGYITFEACANQSVVAYIKRSNLFSKYLFYALLSAREYILTYQTGGAQAGINVQNCKNFIVPYVPIAEQQKIASFLDGKCAEIDEMIALQEKIVEELKAYKQSVITEAVTKGLNPDVPMKDSGIEWIGEIPEHWEVGRMKNLCNQNPNSLSEKTDKDIEFDYVDIGSVSFEKGVFNTEHYKFSEAPSRARRKANFGDFIMSTVRTYLRAIDVIDTQEKANYIYSTGFAVLTPKAHISYKFLSYISKSQYFLEQVTTLSRGINYPSINSTDLMTICVAHPSIEEQIQISDYLDKRCTEIDNLISIKLSKIDSLKEYKKSIIYEYVTGKKEVKE